MSPVMGVWFFIHTVNLFLKALLSGCVFYYLPVEDSAL